VPGSYASLVDLPDSFDELEVFPEAFEESPALEEVEEDDSEDVPGLDSDPLEDFSPDSLLSAFFRSAEG
jgi:hypothetical protein